MGAIQVKALSTQGTRSRLARAQPRAGTVDQGDSRLARGPPQAVGAPRLARGQAQANFVVQQPRPNRLTNRPYRMRI